MPDQVDRNGQLKEYLTSGLQKEVFTQRLKKALELNQDIRSEAADSNVARSESDMQVSAANGADNMDSSAAAQRDIYQVSANQRERIRLETEGERSAEGEPHYFHEEAERRSTQEEEARVATERQRRLEEYRREEIGRRESCHAEQEEIARRAREEGEQRRKAAAEKAARDRKSQGAPKHKFTPAEQAHHDEVRRQKEENRKEHQRILAKIESERQERRDVEEARRMNREERRRLEAEKEASEETERSKQKKLFGIPCQDGTTCALQVRLFDGSLIRARFGGNSTLKQHVREWVDDSIRMLDGGPKTYKFKWIRSPQTNTTIDNMDEEKTVLQLEMVPTSTLVIVPVVGQEGPRILTPILAFISLIFSFLEKILQIFIPGLRNRDQLIPGNSDAEDIEGHGRSTGIDHGRKSNTIERKKRQEQYYNGNSVSFKSITAALSYGPLTYMAFRQHLSPSQTTKTNSKSEGSDTEALG